MQEAHAEALCEALDAAKTYESKFKPFGPTARKVSADVSLSARAQHGDVAAHWRMRTELLEHMQAQGDGSVAARVQACVQYALGRTASSALSNLDELVREKHSFFASCVYNKQDPREAPKKRTTAAGGHVSRAFTMPLDLWGSRARCLMPPSPHARARVSTSAARILLG